MAKITVPLHIDRGKYSIGDENYASSSTRRYLLCRHNPTVIAAAITSQTGKANLPTHISLAARSCGLTRDSVILLEQVRTLDKSRLRERMGRLDEPAMHQVDNAIAVSFGLPQ